MILGTEFEAGEWFHVGAVEIAMRDIRGAFERRELESDVGLSAIKWEILKPGEPRVPKTDDESPTLRMLVGHAHVIRGPRKQGFLHELDALDRHLLRRLTRRLHQQQCGEWSRELTDAEIDGVIEDYGAEVAEEMLRQEVKEKTL